MQAVTLCVSAHRTFHEPGEEVVFPVSPTDGVLVRVVFWRVRHVRLSLSWLQFNTSRLLLVCLDVQVTRVVVVGVVLCVSFFLARRSIDWTTKGVMTV